MIKGKTSTGFEFSIDEQRLNNMEFIDALADIQRLEDAEEKDTQEILYLTSNLINLILDKKTKKALYDYVRKEDGTVPIDAVSREVREIIAYNGEQSEDVKN